jgi:UDPglucose 6-dehydrogenase
MIDLVQLDLGADLKGKRIAVLGAAFKPDSDDVRDSPALDIAAQVAAAGADVYVFDPKANSNAKLRFPALNYSNSVEECLSGAEIVLHLTEWKEFRALDPIKVKNLVARPNIIDGRNALDKAAWESAGWHFRGLGRATR